MRASKKVVMQSIGKTKNKNKTQSICHAFPRVGDVYAPREKNRTGKAPPDFNRHGAATTVSPFSPSIEPRSYKVWSCSSKKKVSPKVKQEGEKGEGKGESTKANFRATNFPVKVGKNVKLVVYSAVGGGGGLCS